MKVDLHCHSTASDGCCEPFEVLSMAAAAGVELLALTDHDTVAGVLALRETGGAWGACQLLPGIEFSSRWRGRGIHVLGLGIDPDAAVITDAVAAQQKVRDERAQRIGEQLRRQGVEDAYAGALALAGGSAPCRPHFAQVLVARGHCRDGRAAFERYLGNRRLKGLDFAWPDLEVVVGWIVAAGGIAVLAHPDDYKLTRTKLFELARHFFAVGGRGLELAAQGRPEAGAELLEQLCREIGLAASVGSDFHGGDKAWRQLGRVRVVPPDLTPVWHLLSDVHSEVRMLPGREREPA